MHGSAVLSGTACRRYRRAVTATTAETAATTVGAEGAARVRTLRAIAAAIVFVGFGAAAHRVGVGLTVPVIPFIIVVVLVAPMVWLVVPTTASVSRALVAACSAQVIMHVALLSMEPSTGGSATRAHGHQDSPAVPLGDTLTVAGTALPMSLIQALVAAALLSSVVLVVADDVLRTLLRPHPRAPLPSPPP